MDRRSYLKQITAAGLLGAISWSGLEWIWINRSVSAADLHRKHALIAELAEIIIPETDTPGAKTAGVAEYIMNVMINCNTVRQQRKFFDGLEQLEKYARDKWKLTFMECSRIQQENALGYMAAHSAYSYNILNKINHKFFGKPFFVKLKDLTVEGYCLSEAGATKGLAYDYIPGSYTACSPLKFHQKSWATK